MAHRFRWAVLLMLVPGMLALVSSAPVVYAANQVVSDCGDNGGPNQLRAKLNAANATGGGTITFTCGPSIVLTSGALPSITTNITLNGGGISISGNNASRIFVVEQGTFTLNNLTIANGYEDYDGGAIYNGGGTLNINHSKFLSNQTTVSGSGGAIFTEGALNITNSEFANNKGANGGALMLFHPGAVTKITGTTFHDNQTISTTDGWGGAILVFDGASATVSSGTFNLNRARSGGAVYVHLGSSSLTVNDSAVTNNKASVGSGGGIWNGGTATLTNVTLNANEAGGVGGGVFNRQTATLSKVTLSNNQADWGGGINNEGSSLVVLNSTFSENSATGRGGGLNNDDAGVAALSNVTFSGNSALNGGGIYSYDTIDQIKNTLLVKGASGQNCYSVSPGSFNLSDDNSCGFGIGRDNVANLNLGALTNNGGFTKTHLPGAGSAAIDQGQCTDANVTPVTSDQRGVSRPKGLACDVGSVEVVPATPTPSRTPTGTPTKTPTTPTCSVKPTKPVLQVPTNGTNLTITRPKLKWSAAQCAKTYRVVVIDSVTGQVVDKASGLTDLKYKTDPLLRGKTYKWSVKACNPPFGCAKSGKWLFTVE